MHDVVNTFAHSAVRGAGWSAGRILAHYAATQFGVPLLFGLVVLSILMSRGRRR